MGPAFMSKSTNNIILVRRDRMFLIPTLIIYKKKAIVPNVRTEKKKNSLVPFSTVTSKVLRLMGIKCVGRPSTTSVPKSFHCDKYLATGGMISPLKRVLGRQLQRGWSNCGPRGKYLRAFVT